MDSVSKKSTTLNITTSLLIAIFIECAFMYLRTISFVLSGIVFFILYSAIIVIIGSRNRRKAVLYAAVFAIVNLTINVTIRTLWWGDTLVSLPEEIMHLLGIICGVVLVKCPRITRIVIVFIMIALCLVFDRIYIHWLQYLSHNNLTGAVLEQVNGSPLIENTDGDTIDINTMRGSYIVLDCCYTNCGVCIKKLPKIQQLHEKYNNNPKIQVYVLFFRLDKETNKMISEWLSKRGNYSFPVLFGDFNELCASLKVSSFPEIIIINPSGEIVFRGRIELAENYLKQIN